MSNWAKDFFSSASSDGFALSIHLQLGLGHFHQTESADDFSFFSSVAIKKAKNLRKTLKFTAKYANPNNDTDNRIPIFIIITIIIIILIDGWINGFG